LVPQEIAMVWLALVRSIRIIFLGIVLAASASLLAPAALAERYASIVVDAKTGEVLHARHEDEPRYPASLTKVMTLYMLFDALDRGEITLSERLTVSRHAARQPPSSLALKAGDSITVEDAIYALVSKSANDVAVVVAERLGGTEARFGRMMTARARELGLTDTVFRNASGLPDTQQLSTARDLALLAGALLENHQSRYHYFSSRRFTWGRTTYRNHNELVGNVEGVDGIKTGYTRASGFNLMTSAERDGHRIIVIMLGGATARARNEHVEDLVEAAYSSLAEPAFASDQTGLRPRLAFASITAPRNPNAAAEPLLNGKPLSEWLSQPAPQTVIEQPEVPLMEGDGALENSYMPAGAPEERLAEVPNEVTAPAIAETVAAPAPQVILPGPTPEEYRSRQIPARESSSIAAYRAGQIRR
jgi:D-alanyl-D-alanine carboxypeptidase